MFLSAGRQSAFLVSFRGLAAACVLLGATDVPALAATFTVDSTADAADANAGDALCRTSGNVCTLRAAIQQANATAGSDLVRFGVAGTIAPASPLPAVTGPATIDGTTAPGWAGAPVVVLAGGGAGAGAVGLDFAAGSDGSVIRALSVQGFASHGIVIRSHSASLTRNHVGTNAAGSSAAGNGGYGIVVFGNSGVVGGANHSERNIVSGNVLGGIAVSGGTGNVVQFSYIGTNVGGTAAIPNGSGVTLHQTSANTLRQNVISGNAGDGVIIAEGGSNSIVTFNLIGLNATGAGALANAGSGVSITNSTANAIGLAGNGNIISGNAVAGVTISGAASTGNTVRGNFIGTRLSGVQAQGNGTYGVYVTGASGNKVGEVGGGNGNVICGNARSGVLIEGGSGNHVLSNVIGVDPGGVNPLPNGDGGIAVVNSPNTTVGLTGVDGSGNLVAGNVGNGIFVTGSSNGSLIAGNTVGSSGDGLTAVPNTGHGIVLVGVSGATIGGMVSGQDNQVAGNALNGIYISGGSNNVVLVNEVGIDGTGLVMVPNGQAGILVENAAGTTLRSSLVSGNAGHGIRLAGGSGSLLIANIVGLTLGGDPAGNGGHGVSIESSGANVVGRPVAGEGNVISSNAGAGISIVGGVATGNVVQNTVIGYNVSANQARPNGQDGIVLTATSGNLIGGVVNGANIIANNAGNGVAVLSGSANPIRMNLIHSNGRLAIDLDRDGTGPADGVTTNDRADADGGANLLQNHPVLTAASTSGLDAVMRGAPSTQYAIDLFGNAACDSAGFGEGATYLGSTTVTTDVTGEVTFDMAHPPVSSSAWLAATATDPAGNTSEFSQCIRVGRRPVDTLALFNPDFNYVSLISSPEDIPPAWAYNNFVATPPGQGQWVMGDWDGDGIETPAVYAVNGAFYYTNEVGQTAAWTGIWFGHLGKPALAGRFDPAASHDCLGVVDDIPWPGFGTAFAMYFTCDLTSGEDPPKGAQWLSAPLPDSQGFTGEFQFLAGDFNADGVDTVAVRRNLHVVWTNTPAGAGAGNMEQAQYLGDPGGGTSRAVAGDWDGNGTDSFGLFHANGRLYRRDDLVWNSGQYALQRVGTPIGAPVIPRSWRPGSKPGAP